MTPIEIIDQANQLRDEGRIRESIDTANQLLTSDNPDVIIQAYNCIGLAYLELDEYDDTIDTLKKALDIAQNNNLTSHIENLFRDISFGYSKKRDFDEALVWLQKSLAQTEINPDSDYDTIRNRAATKAVTLARIGLIYTWMDNINEAEKAFLESQELVKSSTYQYWNISCNLYYAYFLAQKKKNYELATHVLTLAIESAAILNKPLKLADLII